MNERFFPEKPRFFTAANAPRFLTIPFYHLPPVAGRLDLDFVMPCSREVELCCAGMAGYQLILDGEIVHRGPEWRSYGLTEDKFKVKISVGKHLWQIMLWGFGVEAGYREMNHTAAISIYPADENDVELRDMLGTGYAPYRTGILRGVKTAGQHMSCMAAPRLYYDYRVDISEYGTAQTIHSSTTAPWLIYERTLPLLREERQKNLILRAADEKREGAFYSQISDRLRAEAETLGAGGKVVIPANSHCRMLFDCGDYICAFSNVKFDKGKDARVELMLTEALFTASEDWRKCYYNPDKGNRSEIDGKFAAGTGDVFIADGEKHTFRAFDWDAGRYLAVKITTADEALELEDLHLMRTNYPLEITGRMEWRDEELNKVVKLCINSVYNCMHTTYMDCPHYEQLMYAGDGRLEMLVNYMLTSDRRLQRKALREFASSQNAAGLTMSRYPSRDSQVIPPFALYFIAMIHDYASWDDDTVLVQDLLPVAHRIIEAFLACRENGGDLICNPAGWNFYDWPYGWDNGVPPGSIARPGALLNCHLIYTLDLLAELEDYAGSQEYAAQYRQEAQRLRQAVQARFFVAQRHLFSDEDEHKCFSQQTQSMALLAGLGDREVYENMFKADLTPCTVYFSHYIFEASKLFNDGEHTMDLLKFWKDLPSQGFMTAPERPEPSRSDCHGWGSHPLYYMVTGIAGIQPVGFGGKVFAINPAAGKNLPDGIVEIVLPGGSVKVIRCNGKIEVESTGNISIKQSITN